MIQDYFRVTGVNDSVLDYADLFTVALRDDNIQEFGTRWDEMLLSMDLGKSVHDKIRIRESEKLKTVLEMYNLEIHQQRAKPDYHRLKTMVNGKKKEVLSKNSGQGTFGLKTGELSPTF